MWLAPTPVEELEWSDLGAGGITAMGEALRLVAAELHSPPMEARALPPVLVLISDGQPTDDFDGGLAALMREPWAQKAVRLAIAMGHDADLEVLQSFIGPEARGQEGSSAPAPAGEQCHLPGPVHPVGLHRRGGGRLHARQPGGRRKRRGERSPAGSAPHGDGSDRRCGAAGVVNGWALPLCRSRIGAAHRRRGLPCQDASLSASLPSGDGLPVQVMAVADGHGHRLHWRSEVGSRLACQVAIDAVRA